jgi:hypothetical protein
VRLSTRYFKFGHQRLQSSTYCRTTRFLVHAVSSLYLYLCTSLQTFQDSGQTMEEGLGRQGEWVLRQGKIPVNKDQPVSALCTRPCRAL